MPKSKKSARKSFKKNVSPSKRVKKGNRVRVYVAHITDPDEDELKEFIGDSGTPLSITWLNHQSSGKFRGCGFVDFATQDEANNFVEKSKSPYQGKTIQIKHASVGGEGGFSGEVQMYVGNVADDDEGALKKFIGNARYVKRIRWLTDDAGDFRGCGFVDFANAEHADRFMKKNGKMCGGNQLNISYAPSNKPCAFVMGFVADTMDDAKLMDFVGGTGEIVNIRWMNDNTYAFVTFDSIVAMNDFIRSKNNTELGDRTIRVRVAKKSGKNQRKQRKQRR